MIPAAYLHSLLALGCGGAGVLVGLFIGFAPEPQLAALRRARRSTTTALREGDFVCLEGVLETSDPMEGAVSQQPVAVQKIEHTGYVNPNSRSDGLDIIHTAVRTATGLALNDGQGRVFIHLEEGQLLATSRWSARESAMVHRWTTVAMPDTIELSEESIAPGAQVVLLGEAAWDGKGWVLRGRDLFLTDVTREKLEKSDARGRMVGLAIAALSMAASIAAAVMLAG